MPDTTPIYGFPYPCEGDDISVTAFANLANAIDAKLLQLQSDEFEALNRYNSSGSSDIMVVAAGVDTVATGPDATYTIPVAGCWIITANTVTTGDPTTITSHRIRVRKNAVVQFGVRQNPETGVVYDIYTTGMLMCAAGDVISFQTLFSGTGNWTLTVDWEARMIVRIP